MKSETDKLEEVLDLVEGRLSHDDVARLTADIEADAALRAAHEWARHFRSMAERTTLVCPPAGTHARLATLLPQPQTASSAVSQFVEIVARLIRDVTAGPMFAGARGVALDSKRQLLFGAGDGTDVTIELEFIDDVLRVSGHLLADATAAGVSLTADGSTTEFETNVNGEFSTTIATPTSAQLSITTTSQRIHLDLTPYLDPAGSAPLGTS